LGAQENEGYSTMMLLLAQAFPEMEWIPLMLLLTVGGLTAAFLAFVLRLFPRTWIAGRRLGYAAIVIGVGSPLFFLCVVGSRVAPSAYFLFATPAPLGGVAVLLYPRVLRETRGFAVLTEQHKNR
jgi:hypothetical protein